MATGTFNLNNFAARIANDSLARTNRFEVDITMPAGLGAVSRDKVELVSLYCEQTSLPGFSISTKPFKVYGPTYQRPVGSEYGGEGISMTFHVDRDMRVRKFFEDWMHVIVNPDDFTVAYQNQYATTINIRQLDELNNITHQIELLEAFPRNMNLMDLNNASTNQTHRVNILFAYRYWRNIDVPKRTTPVALPRNIQRPQVPVSDAKPARKGGAAVGDIGNPMGDISNYGNGW